MAGLQRADYVDMLQEMYPQKRSAELILRDRPELAMLERTKTKGGGRYTHIPIKGVRPQGRSATFTDAQTNRTPSDYDAFQVTYVSNYGYATVDSDTIDDAGENVELVADCLMEEVDGAIENLADDLAYSLHGNGGGYRGIVGSISTTTLTLATTTDILNFEKNMELVASENDGSTGSLQDSGASATVTGIDYDAGTLTSDSNWTSQMASLDAGDYLFVEGDFGNKLSGFEAWNPVSAPGATAFFGVDRSTNSRYGGMRSTETGKPLEEGLMNAITKLRRHGARPDMGLMDWDSFNSLCKSAESKAHITRTTVNGTGEDAANFGFEAVNISGVNFIPSSFAPANIVRIFQKDSWKLLYCGSDLIRLWDDDDQKFQREASNDGVEFRIKNRGNLACNAPSRNIRVAV